jgi:hypothetical protein
VVFFRGRVTVMTRRRGVSNSGLSDSCGALLVGQQSRRERSEEVQVATVVFGHKSRDRQRQ